MNEIPLYQGILGPNRADNPMPYRGTSLTRKRTPLGPYM